MMKALLLFTLTVLFVHHAIAEVTVEDFKYGGHILGSFDLDFEKYFNKSDSYSFLQFHKCEKPLYRLEKLRLKHLRVFALKNCGIKEIADDAFDGVAHSLEELDLSRNLLTNFPDLRKFPKLKKLILNSNPIGHIFNVKEGSEVKSLGIEHLEIAQTEIRQLTSSTFSRFKNLKVLDISFNPNPQISADAFSSLKLESLTMKEVDFTTLPTYLFDSLTTLTKLSLSNNQIVTIPTNAFTKLPNLKELDLQLTMLTILPAGAFNGLQKLETLDLSRNGISHLPTEIFAGLQSLKTLDLTGNALPVIQTGLLSHLESLEKLHLRYSRITAVMPSSLPPLEKLKKVDLTHNMLTTLTIDSFAPPKNHAQIGTGVYNIRISGNPLVCDSRLGWLVRSYKSQPDRSYLNNPFGQMFNLFAPVFGREIEEPADDPICAAPFHYAGVPLKYINVV